MVIDIACQLADVCLIPIPTFFSAEQMEHVFEKVLPDAVISEQPDIFTAMLQRRNPRIRETPIGRYGVVVLDPAQDDFQLPVNTGKITFTSGSTARPKGVCLGNQQLIKQAQALAEAVDLQTPRHIDLIKLQLIQGRFYAVETVIILGFDRTRPILLS